MGGEWRHVVRCWAWSRTNVSTGKDYRKRWGYIGLAWRHDCSTVPNPRLCSLSYIHLLQSLSFCLGQCYLLLRSRVSPAFVTSLARLQSSLMILSLPILSHYSSIPSVRPKASHPLPFSSSVFPILMHSPLLPLPTRSFSIHIRGHLWDRVCASAPFSVQRETYIFSTSPPLPPLLFLISLIQILVLVLRCSSFFRLKAMCHSLLLSLCLFLHLFLPLPPTQSLSPLPTQFSLLSIDVIVCAQQFTGVFPCTNVFLCVEVVSVFVLCHKLCTESFCRIWSDTENNCSSFAHTPLQPQDFSSVLNV